MGEFFNHFLESFQVPLESPILVFSLILMIILLSPILLGRLNIPGIIGLIIAGIMIGPKGFHIIENNSAIELFSTIGLLYIMFIAGLELDLKEFKANRNRSISFGILTFMIPLGIGYPICHYFLGYDVNASLLTSSMFATHTLVAYPIVSKLGISKNQAVAVTVGGTILTDTAVLILLAVIVGNAEGNLSQDFWIKLGISLTIFSFIMFFIIPRIARWFFEKLKHEKHSHYIFVLSVVFFAAFLAEVAGVEAIIGAFMAGLALNKLIPHNSSLMNRIEFLGNAFFIPFFLISVGMLVDVRVIFSGIGAWIVAGTLTIVALFSKWLAAWFTQIIFKFSGAQRQVIFGLSSAHAAATLAVILVGYNVILGYDELGDPIRLLDDNILNGTIILILVTSIVATFATENAAKKIVIDAENDVEGLAKSSGAKSEHILVPIDNYEKINRLMELAFYIKDQKSPNPISMLTVVSNNEDSNANLAEAKTKLDEFADKNKESKTKVNVLTTIDHHAATGIARVSREIMTDLILLGWPSQSSGFIDRLIGIGEKVDNIVNQTGKTSFVCKIQKPITQHTKIVVTVPPLAEREVGFATWLNKILTLAERLDIPIEFYGNKNTIEIAEKLFSKLKSPVITLKEYDSLNNITSIVRDISENDLLIFVSAKRGGTSYTRVLENMPSRIIKLFPTNSLIVIFPQHFIDFNKKDSDISTEGIKASIEAVQKVSRGIGSIFKKTK